MTTYDFNIRDYWHIVRKRKMVVIFTTLMLGFFSFTFGTLRKPIPIYRATSSVKIDQNVALAGRYFDSGGSGSTDNLETQATIISSFPIMEVAAQQLGLIPHDLPPEDLRSSNVDLNKILALKSQIDTTQEGFTNIINIHATSRDRKFAQKLANTVAQVYMEQHNRKRNKRTRDARRFIEKQLILYRQKLRAAEGAVRRFREENHIISIDAQSGTTLGQLDAVRVKEQEFVDQLSEIDEIIRQLRETRRLDNTKRGSFFAGRASAMFVRMSANLTDLNVKRDTLLLEFTPAHPLVADLDLQIREVLRAMMDELSGQRESIVRSLANIRKERKNLEKYAEVLPQLGLRLARLERQVALNGELFTFLERKYQEALINESEQVEEVSVVRPALLPTVPINQPNLTTTTMVGVVLGSILGLVFAFILETLDTSIGRIEDIENYINVPVLGVIPYFELETREGDGGEFKSHPEDSGRQSRALLSSYYSQNSSAAEAYRALRTNLQFLLREKNIKTLILTSTTPREGKSTISVNIAIAMALVGMRTILLDCDLRRPTIARYFGIENDIGFTDVIVGNCHWNETVKTVADIIMGQMGLDSVLNTPGIDNLNFMVSGKIPLNPTEMLNSKRTEELIEEISQSYDLVLIDSPPILPVTDAVVLGSKVDGVVMVYLAGETGRKSLMHAKGQMDAVKAEVIGVVLNGLKMAMSPDYMDYGYYHYYGQAEEVASAEGAGGGVHPLRRLKRLLRWPWGNGKFGGDDGGQEFALDRSSTTERSVVKTVLVLLAAAALLLGLLMTNGYLPGRTVDFRLALPFFKVARTSKVPSQSISTTPAIPTPRSAQASGVNERDR